MIQKWRFFADQGLRTIQYLGQSTLGNWLVGRTISKSERETLPHWTVALEEIKKLYLQDWENINRGVYKAPDSIFFNPVELSKNSWRFFADLASVKQRERDGSVTVRNIPKEAAGLPKYFTQTFHYQTDGYLSDRSAELYDHQVELVFGGCADAMRRQSLPFLYDEQKRKPGQRMEVLDLACGTGRFLKTLCENYPEHKYTGVDLSPFYLRRARRTVDGLNINLVSAAGEDLPFKEGIFDVVFCIYLFHELPSRVRKLVCDEISRVLKPGGMLVFMDSIQLGDNPALDGSLAFFPKHFHEPYYADFVGSDLESLFASVGLKTEKQTLAFYSKILCLRKSL